MDSLLEVTSFLIIEPRNSNDPETLGLWGAVHKRLWELTRGPNYLDEAIRAYERGFTFARLLQWYQLCFPLNIRASASTDHAEAVADFVQAGGFAKKCFPFVKSGWRIILACRR